MRFCNANHGQIPSPQMGLPQANLTAVIDGSSGVRGNARSGFGCDWLHVHEPDLMACAVAVVDGTAAIKPHVGPAAGRDPGV